MFGLNTLGRIAGHSAAKKSAKYRNRARLAKYEAEKSQYLHEVTLNDAQYKNDVSIQEGNQDMVYQAMVDQWVEKDNQLDKIFNDGRFQIMDSLVNSYQNEYAGSGAGVTAGRLAAESVRRHGHEKAKLLSQMMLAKDHTYNQMEAIRNRADSKRMELYEAVRFAPIHGPTPIAPELEAIPGTSGLLLGIATDAVSSFALSKLFKAPPVGGGGSSSAIGSGSGRSAIDAINQASNLSQKTGISINSGVTGTVNLVDDAVNSFTVDAVKQFNPNPLGNKFGVGWSSPILKRNKLGPKHQTNFLNVIET